jgi:hypothetical protein
MRGISLPQNTQESRQYRRRVWAPIATPITLIGFIATGGGRLDAVPEGTVARDIHDRKGRLEMQPAMRTGQHGHLSAFAGMTPVAMATATACVKLMQLNLWRAVSR